MVMCINVPPLIIILDVLSSYLSNPPLSEEMLPPGEWMCHRCNVRKKVSRKSACLDIHSLPLSRCLRNRKLYLCTLWIDKSVQCSLFALVRSESRSQNRPTAYQRGLYLSAQRPLPWSWSSMLGPCGWMACHQVLGQQGLVYELPRCASWTAGPAAGPAAGLGLPPPTLHPPQLHQRNRMTGKMRQQSPRMKFRAQSLRALHYPLPLHASSNGPFSC